MPDFLGQHFTDEECEDARAEDRPKRMHCGDILCDGSCNDCADLNAPEEDAVAQQPEEDAEP